MQEMYLIGIVAAVLYVTAIILSWKIEKSIDVAIEKIVLSSKQVKKQKKLLEESRKNKNILRHIFWPITFYK
jgi:hypothetical protein